MTILKLAAAPTALLVLLTSACLEPQTVTSIEGGAVEIAQGALQGSVEDGVAVFRGIPYAAAPVGDLRWREPGAAPEWDGVRDATANGAACTEAEDCLFLNVFAPADATSESKLPVFVYIHGGGFAGGSGGGTDGAKFARAGVITVPINYRLGRAGWFAHPAITAENPDGLLGNYGNMDQIAALEWVRNNIARFGGDPENVTVGGSSAGAISSTYIMMAPQAEGLFAKVISESNFGRLDVAPIRSAEEAGLEWAGLVGVEGEGPEAAAALRALPYETLRAPAEVTNPAGRPRPIIDGVMITGTIVEGFQEGKDATVPLLLGDTDDDSSFFRRGIDFDARYAELAAIPGFLEAFDPEGTRESERVIAQVMTHESNREPDRAIARLHASRAPTYVYHFTYVPEESRDAVFGAGHTAETRYLFGADSPERPYDEEGRAVSDSLNAYWAAFMTHGDPGAAGGPDWPEFELPSEERLFYTRTGAPEVRANIDPAPMDWIESQVEQ